MKLKLLSHLPIKRPLNKIKYFDKLDNISVEISSVREDKQAFRCETLGMRDKNTYFSNGCW